MFKGGKNTHKLSGVTKTVKKNTLIKTIIGIWVKLG